MDTKDEKPAGLDEHGAADSATMRAARAIQAHAGTPSAVEYLKARDFAGRVIARVLADELPAPDGRRSPGQAQ